MTDEDDVVFDRRERMDVKKPGPFFEASPNNFYLDKLTYRYDDADNNSEDKNDVIEGTDIKNKTKNENDNAGAIGNGNKNLVKWQQDLKISSNGNKIFRNLVKWQQDFKNLVKWWQDLRISSYDGKI